MSDPLIVRIVVSIMLLLFVSGCAGILLAAVIVADERRKDQ